MLEIVIAREITFRRSFHITLIFDTARPPHTPPRGARYYAAALMRHTTLHLCDGFRHTTRYRFDDISTGRR